MTTETPKYFKIGFRETKTGSVLGIEAFSDPHDEELLTQFRRLAPDARMHERHRLLQVRVRLEDARVEILGDFATSAAREAAKYIALLGVRALKERVREAFALELGTRMIIHRDLIANPSRVHLPARILTHAGTEDRLVEIEGTEVRPILLSLDLTVKGNEVTILVPSLRKDGLFGEWGNNFRRAIVHQEASRVLNAHGLFTFA